MLCNVIDVAFSDITSTLFLHPYFHYKKCLQDKERCVCWTNEDILRPSCVNSSYYLGQFPAVDVTNYHTFCCCKQEKAPHSWLWRTGVQIQVCTTTSSPHSLQGRGQGPSTAFRAEDRVPHAFRAEDSLHPIAFRAEDSLPPCPQTSGQPFLAVSSLSDSQSSCLASAHFVIQLCESESCPFLLVLYLFAILLLRHLHWSWNSCKLILRSLPTFSKLFFFL